MSLFDDLTAEAKRKEIKIEFRGHKVIVKTLLGMESAPYFKYITDNKLDKIADWNAAMIAASIFTEDGERLPPEAIPGIRDNWSQHELGDLMQYCEDVGNNLLASEKKKKG